MSDNTLTTLMGNVPSRFVSALLTRNLDPDTVFRCILLLEDLDAAFTRGVSRDETSTGAPTGGSKSPSSTSSSTSTSKNKDKDENDGSTLSLSGLLNSLDGVAAAEGR